MQQLFGDTGVRIIGDRHGEKLYETLPTSEERMHATDMGGYFKVAADTRDLNYDKYFVEGTLPEGEPESYTSHNTTRLDVPGIVDKLMTLDYIKEELAKE